MPAILSTHIEPFTINYSKPNTKVMKESWSWYWIKRYNDITI
jgi:hypothetical protein